MKAVILGSGYAARLLPLTKNKEKPFLEISGKPIIDYIVEKIIKVSESNEVVIATNGKFAGQFEEWDKTANHDLKINKR